jgi:RNA polymerase sigma-70 factor (subfamily 1)
MGQSVGGQESRAGDEGVQLDVPDLSRSIELVKLVQGGDRAALDELFERYKPRLLRIIRVKMGARLQRYLDEEDILQEVFVIAMRKVQEFELRTHAGILQWLARIAQNEISSKVEFYTAQKRDAAQEVPLRADSGTRHGVLVSAAEPSPSQHALRAEFEELVDSYVQELDPAEYRDVILRRDYYQEEWEEIRTGMGRPTVEAAQELYRRAYKRLREHMSKHLERP